MSKNSQLTVQSAKKMKRYLSCRKLKLLCLRNFQTLTMRCAISILVAPETARVSEPDSSVYLYRVLLAEAGPVSDTCFANFRRPLEHASSSGSSAST